MNANISSVNYNGSLRKWEVRRGTTVVEFDAGPQGKQAAHTLAIQTDAPQVFKLLKKLIKNHPNNEDLHRRAWKAALLASHRYVLKPYNDRDNQVARVASQTKPIEYSIACNPNWPESVYTCQCPDWTNGMDRLAMSPTADGYPPHGAPALPRAGIICKHVLAYIFAHTANIPLADYSPVSSTIASDIWITAVKEITHNMPQVKPILEDTQAVQMGRGTLTIATATHNLRNWLDDNFRRQIQDHLNNVAPQPLYLHIQGA